MADVLTKPKKKNKIKYAPMYNVILMNDEDHTYYYVVRMLKELFAFTPEQGFEAAKKVHEQGSCVLKTCTKELAELKQEQIHAFGKDDLVERCSGSMTCHIEPVE